jgi:hypothetical protein
VGLTAATLTVVVSLGAGSGCREEAIAPVGMLPDDGTGSTGLAEPPSSADLCQDAAPIGPGSIEASLRGRTVAGGGACGNGGPDAFHLLQVPQRSDVRIAVSGRGFEAVAGVLPSTCVLDWSARGLLCTRGVEGWVTDVPGGAELLIAIGIDPDDPALQSVVEPGGFDPLDYTLHVELREVLEAGKGCDSAEVRCAAGTACLPVEDPAAVGIHASAPKQCTALPADICRDPEPILLSGTTQQVVIPTEAVHTDAHQHQCTGARTPERVLRLEFPPETRTPATVEIASSTAVGLAVRAGGCEASREVACHDGGGSVSVALDDVAVRDGLFVFVELSPLFSPDLGDDDSAAGPERGEEPPSPVVLDISLG